MAKHCVVIGVGPGLGLATVRRFLAAGYTVSMLARHEGRLASWRQELDGTTAYPADIAEIDAYRDVLGQIIADHGLPDVVVYNAAKASFGQYESISVDDFEKNFRINTTGLLVTAQVFGPLMAERGHGALMVTGNTGAMRGTPNFVGWSPSKAGQRILSESLARTLGPAGVHVAYIVVDALIDMPFARRGREDVPRDHFAQPDDLAESILSTALQPRSAWSFLVELRPFAETW